MYSSSRPPPITIVDTGGAAATTPAAGGGAIAVSPDSPQSPSSRRRPRRAHEASHLTIDMTKLMSLDLKSTQPVMDALLSPTSLDLRRREQRRDARQDYAGALAAEVEFQGAVERLAEEAEHVFEIGPIVLPDEDASGSPNPNRRGWLDELGPAERRQLLLQQRNLHRPRDFAEASAGSFRRAPSSRSGSTRSQSRRSPIGSARLSASQLRSRKRNLEEELGGALLDVSSGDVSGADEPTDGVANDDRDDDAGRQQQHKALAAAPRDTHVQSTMHCVELNSDSGQPIVPDRNVVEQAQMAIVERIRFVQPRSIAPSQLAEALRATTSVARSSDVEERILLPSERGTATLTELLGQQAALLEKLEEGRPAYERMMTQAERQIEQQQRETEQRLFLV